MTKQEAKELAIELWQYLADHPRINGKRDLPPILWNKINRLPAECPLCAVVIGAHKCKGCPLYIGGVHCWDTGGSYLNWLHTESHDVAGRQEAAQKIVDLIKAWEPEEEE